MNKEKILSTSNYNIGFSITSKEEMIKNKCISKIHWMKHEYHDRFFADPFILDVTDEYIKVLVEECSFENLHHAGIISELWVDRKTYKLKQRFELLKMKTHLSYPAIIREEGKVYVYPESNESGVLSLYEYDEKAHKLVNPI